MSTPLIVTDPNERSSAPIQNPKQRGFARTTAAHDAHQLSSFGLQVELVKGLFVRKIEIVTDVFCTKLQRVSGRDGSLAVRNKFTVKQCATHAVSKRSSRGQENHPPHTHVLVVDSLIALVGGTKQEKGCPL